MSDTVAKLHFTPVHPFHRPFGEVLSESSQGAAHIEGVLRTQTLYISTDGLLHAMVCFHHGGSLDDARCYDTLLDSNTSFRDPRQAVNSLEEIGRLCEDQHKDHLKTLC